MREARSLCVSKPCNSPPPVTIGNPRVKFMLKFPLAMRSPISRTVVSGVMVTTFWRMISRTRACFSRSASNS